MPGINQLAKIKGLFVLILEFIVRRLHCFGASGKWHIMVGTLQWHKTAHFMEARKQEREWREPESHNPLHGHTSKDQNFPLCPIPHLPIVSQLRQGMRGESRQGKLYFHDKAGLGTAPQSRGRYQGPRRMRWGWFTNCATLAWEHWRRKNWLTDPGFSVCGTMTQ